MSNDKEREDFKSWNHKWSGYVWFLANHHTSNPYHKKNDCYERTNSFIYHFKNMLDLHPREKFFLSTDLLLEGGRINKLDWRSNNYVNLACIQIKNPSDISNYFEIKFQDVVLILKQSYDLVEKNVERFVITGANSSLYEYSNKENQYLTKNTKYDYGLTIYNIHSNLLL